MIDTNLLQADIDSEQPSLANRDIAGDGYSAIITDSYYEVIQDLIDKRLEVNKLATHLELALKATYTKASVFTKSKIDNLNRQLLILEIFDTNSESHTFQLLGTNDKDSETWTVVLDETEITVASDFTGKKKIFIMNMFKYYKFSHYSDTTATYKVYTLESIYFYLHLYKTIEKIYNTLERKIDDFWNSKKLEYTEKYMKKLNTGYFSYDLDDDEEISNLEKGQNIQINRLIL